MRYRTFQISSGRDLVKVAVAELAVKGIPPTDSEILRWIKNTNFIQRILVEAEIAKEILEGGK